MAFHQQYDWIRLTKVDQSLSGVPFPIQISLNRSPDTIQQVDFYYTDDKNDPTRYSAVEYMPPGGPEILPDTSPAPAQSFSEDYQIFLPVLLKNYVTIVPPPPVENEVLFWWDTSVVTPGEYYTCAVIFDDYNQTTFCSEAPVQIIP